MAYMRDASGKRLDSLVVASQYGVNRPSPGKLAWTNLTAITPTPVPRSIGSDGWVYAALSGGSNRMTRSGDGFATVETTFRFSDAPLSDARAVQYVTRTPEGYVAILCDAAGTTASIYFSTQWNVAASWTKVLDLGMVANISISRWVPRTGGQGTVQLVGEYGNADTRSLYLTEDGGQTWRVIRTHTRQAGGAGVNNHFHGACYDPATGRIWSSAGDEANNWFGYTDDEGATWVPVPADGVGPESGGTLFNHPTVVTPTSKRIVSTPDGAVGNTGIWEIDKVTGANAVSHEVARTQPFRQWSRAPWAQDGDELYLMFPPDTTLGDTARIFVAATGDGGDSWHIVHEEAIDQANDQYFVGIVGPDSAGRIYLAKSNAGVVSLRSAPKLTWHRTATSAALADLPERLAESALVGKYAPRRSGRTAGASLRGSSKVRAMAATPAYAAPVMATPPTITQSDTAGAALTKNVSYTSNVFRWSGPVDTSAGSATPRHYMRLDGVAASSVPASQVAFDFDGDQFDIIIKARTTLKYRVWVNEQAHAATVQPIPSGTGLNAYLNINLGTASLGNPRRIVVEFEDATNLTQFYGIRCAPTHSVFPPSTASPRVLIVGDSYGLGIGATNYSEGYTKTLGRLMGWADCWGAFTSVPSTGLVKAASATAGVYQSRLAADVIPYSPDLVIIQGSLNDNPYVGQNLIGPALTTYVQTLLAAVPNCMVVATSPLFTAAPPANYTGVGTEMAAAAATLGIPYLSIFTPVQFFNGTGTAGAPNASGNADIYRNADSTHPTKEGHHLLARILASQLGPVLGQFE